MANRFAICENRRLGSFDHTGRASPPSLYYMQKTLIKPKLSDLTVTLDCLEPRYPKGIFTTADLTPKLRRGLRRALNLEQVVFLGVQNGTTRKTYATSLTPDINALAIDMGIHRLPSGREKGTGFYPVGQTLTESQKEVLNLFTPERVKRALREASRLYHQGKAAYEYAAEHLRTAWYSDGFGGIVASAFWKVFSEELLIEIQMPKGDKDSDMTFPLVNLRTEIKAMVGVLWQSGEFSQRDTYYTFLLSRNHDATAFWMGLVPAMAWESNIQAGKRRYATKATWNWVRKNPMLKVLHGSISVDGKMVMDTI